MGEGAVFGDGHRTEWFEPFAVEVVDATAAGDAFAAALAIRLAEGVDPFDAVEFGYAAEALAVTRPGRVEVDSLITRRR